METLEKTAFDLFLDRRIEERREEGLARNMNTYATFPEAGLSLADLWNNEYQFGERNYFRA